MHVGWIDQSNLPLFRTFLLPDSEAALELGEPLTALGLMKGEVACGAATAWLDGQDTLAIRSHYDATECRSQGGGRLLVNTRAALGTGLCRSIHCGYTQTLPEHEALAPFFTALGFQPEEEESGIYLTTLKELADSPLFQNRTEPPKGPIPFVQVSTSALVAVYKKAAAAGENYLEIPLTDPSVDQQASVAILEQGMPRSFAVLTRQASDQVTLAWVKSAQPNDLPLMLQSAFARLREISAPETRVAVQTVDDQTAQLMAAILPGVSPISRSFIRPVEYKEGGSL